MMLFKIPAWVWVHPSGKKRKKKQYWVRFTVKSVSMCLRGRPRTLDWWENGGGFNASSSSPWYQKLPPRVSIQQNMTTNWNHGGNKIYMLPLNFPQIHFRGGNTICRMLALQKEIGVGRGWQMKMNGTVWSLGVGGGGGLCVELIPQLLVPSARCDVANTSTDKFI